MKRRLDGIYEGAPALEMYLAGGARRWARVSRLYRRSAAGLWGSGTEGRECL